MRKILGAAVVALMAAGTAHAGMLDYAVVYGGGTLDTDLGYGSGTFDMRTGYNVGGVLGWDIDSNISVGADIMFTRSSYSGFTTALESFSVMGAGYYAFDVGSNCRPFVGLGAGLVQVTYDGADQFPAYSGSEWVFGYEATVGVVIPIADKLGLGLAYKYQGTAEDASIEGKDVEYKSHNISAALVFNLN